MIGQRSPYNPSTYQVAILAMYSNSVTHTRTNYVVHPSLVNDVDIQSTAIQEVANRLADIGDEVALKYDNPYHVDIPSSRFVAKASFQAFLFLLHCPDWIDL